jgi:HSP20 family protein
VLQKRLETNIYNLLKKEKYMTTEITTYKPKYTVGHFSATDRLLNQLPALFNDNWFKNVLGDFDKAFDIPNAVYPYNVKTIKNKNGETEKYIVEVALAGVGKNNIDVKVRDGHLTINILKDEAEEEKNTAYVRKGISRRKGSLSFVLNENTDPKKISSTYLDGLLQVTVPVKQPEIYNIDIKVD